MGEQLKLGLGVSSHNRAACARVRARARELVAQGNNKYGKYAHCKLCDETTHPSEWNKGDIAWRVQLEREKGEAFHVERSAPASRSKARLPQRKRRKG